MHVQLAGALGKQRAYKASQLNNYLLVWAAIQTCCVSAAVWCPVAAAASEDTADTHPHLHKAHRQQSGNMMTSPAPAGRSGSAGRLSAMDEHQQHMQMQQQQQQQHMAHQTADAMQMHNGMMQMAAGGAFAGPMQQQQQQPPMGNGMFMGPGGMH